MAISVKFISGEVVYLALDNSEHTVARSIIKSSGNEYVLDDGSIVTEGDLLTKSESLDNERDALIKRYNEVT